MGSTTTRTRATALSSASGNREGSPPNQPLHPDDTSLASLPRGSSTSTWLRRRPHASVSTVRPVKWLWCDEWVTVWHHGYLNGGPAAGIIDRIREAVDAG
jgi:hypothetical protein